MRKKKLGILLAIRKTQLLIILEEKTWHILQGYKKIHGEHQKTQWEHDVLTLRFNNKHLHHIVLLDFPRKHTHDLFHVSTLARVNFSQCCSVFSQIDGGKCLLFPFSHMERIWAIVLRKTNYSVTAQLWIFTENIKYWLLCVNSELEWN